MAEEEQAKLDEITPDEREKTIRCLLKVMNYQLEGVQDQYKQMETSLKKNEREMLDYQRELEERANRIKLDEMTKAFERTK